MKKHITTFRVLPVKGGNMKATGIVRRIDDLGRIVIPKEIRRNLRIRETDPIEIFTDKSGEIILKKYSPMGELTSFASQCAKSVAQVSGKTVLITDREYFISASGGCKELVGREISRQLQDIMENRVFYRANQKNKGVMLLDSGIGQEQYQQLMIAPILCEGDVIGSVIMLQGEEPSELGESEKKLTMVAAGFLGRHLEA